MNEEKKGGKKSISLFTRKPKEEQTRTISLNNGLPKAVAFVDYEHWYISLKKNFGIQPNIKGWFEELNTKVNLVEVTFFADFSHKSLADQISRIRPYSNRIIDTRNTTGVKKDFTDFIILDNIYQKALSSEDIETFIIFSGDGHFSSVVSFLKNFCKKEVGIYGIEDSFSRQLQQTASWCITLPTEEDVHGSYYRLIFEVLKKASESNSKDIPTQEKTVKTVCALSKTATNQKVTEALNNLIDKGYISTRTVVSYSDKKKTKKVTGLFTDWEKVEKSGFLAQ
ncbi:MAG: NYN domain-containing protein [Clostridia bacterium]|nr:NYN domain-containing protein [Clostridia bacterium]